jgi:LysR family glycine cleavage system transcriptional activator
MQEQHIAVCAPALLGKGSLNLSKQTLLHVLAGDNQRYLTWRHWLDAARMEDVDTSGGYEFDLLDHAIRAAMEGLGVAIADRNMIHRELMAGQLVPVADVQVDGHQSYWFVVRPERKEAKPLQLFRQWLQEEIAASV